MTYRAIDKRRFTYLLSLGTDEFDLKKFFSDSRIQLIQRGGRVQNLPHGEKARIHTLAYELPPSTDEVVRAWFSQHLTMADPESPEVIVETYRLHEEVGEEIDEETARRLARSCLVHLFSESVPPVLLEFLKTSIGGVEKVDEQPKEPSTEKVADFRNFSEVMLDLVQGRDVDRHLDGLPAELATVAVGLHAVAQGRFNEARDALASLPPEASGKAQLDQYIKQQEARGMKEPPRGATVIEPEIFNGTFDFESDEILGYCTKADPPKAVFVHPIAVVRAGVVQLLSPELNRKFFPATGDVMAFAGASYPRQPQRGEVGIWQVEEHQTERATHFHIKGEQRKVYELTAVPFPSTDYDSVREYIKEHAERTASKLLQPPLFVLGDGLVVGPRSERPDLSKDDAFETGLLSWNTVPGLRLEGRLFALAPPMKEQGIYECASISSSIRKLLRPHIGSGGKSSLWLTKAQLSELVQLLGSGEADLNARRLQRIRAEIERIDQNRDALDALVQEILIHPSVKQQVDELVQQEVGKQVAEKNQIQLEIARLQRERGEWEERIRKQKEEHRKLREDTSKVVRAAFEKARTDGVATLAELAIFQELTGPGASRSEGLNRPMSPFQPTVKELAKSKQDAVSVLRSLGVANQKANAFVAAGELAFAVGLIVCVRGMAARLVVERWAQSIGMGVLIDATIGLVDDVPLRTVLNGAPRPDVIAVLDANLSALDIYARSISDAAIDSVLKNQESRPTTILLAMNDGVGHLPLPKSFERLSIEIDLDAKYDFGADVSDLMLRAFDAEDGLLQTRLWRPAAESLRARLSKLDEQTQGLILPVLTAK